MKRLSVTIAAIMLCIGLWQYAEPIAHALAAEQIVMVNLVQPIEIQKSIQTGAKFQELTREAIKYGMGDVVLNGRVTYEPQADSTTRSKIVWDSISMQNGATTLSEPLSSPLESMVRTSQPESSALNRIEPGTSLKAKGDVQTLAEALGRLKAQMDAKTAPIVEKNEKVEKTAVAPVVASSQDSTPQSTNTPTPFNTTVEAGTVTTSEKCDSPYLDYDKMKAYVQYRPIYTKSGVKTGEGVCTPSLSEYTDILKKDGECTYKFDFQNSTAIKEEQWFYMSGSDEILVGTCRDSATTYPLTESRLGCSVTYDMANNKAFPQSKLVFTVGANQMNATSCRPVDANGITLQEENCDPMWEHDFVNNISYLKTRKYYISDVDGSKVYANECGRSSSVSFPHFTDTTGCGWIMDDENKLAYQQGKTIIKTGALAGDVVIQECHTTATVNYTYLGSMTNATRFDTSGSFTFPAGISGGAVLLVSAGGSSQRYDPMDNGGFAGESLVVDFPATVAGKTATFTLDGVVGSDADMGSSWPGPPSRTTTVNIDGQSYTATTPAGFPASARSCLVNNGYFTVGRFGITSSSDYPSYAGTKGFGAGAPSYCGMSTEPFTSPPAQMWLARGAIWYVKARPGVVIFEYTTPKYMRPDGTTYAPAN